MGWANTSVETLREEEAIHTAGTKKVIKTSVSRICRKTSHIFPIMRLREARLDGDDRLGCIVALVVVIVFSYSS